ncbi:biotin--acetyl-CoA-carboxylase ligase [Methylobacterium sp. 4-46]|uniref:biotin--[acetyl-CoA-carboxylase] ligase n=1 Tax=unclassified Methylobacterium TaxID=2615210 RepID=UPI000152DFBD|nr:MULTISPECIES: biotin--[acetyl-CoA-carboxylase] ligase [Methylobacterium]ACA18746.1 biotin--acetyl-CoA-carboxylase ligase [Methylobacterium sp. 4-46]WFT77976.1 biotin--[acetyl-CoA-carboxylase] ligase [Methylobacterium nodulans]
MAFSLDPAAEAAGYRLEAHDTLGSTSTQAMARAREGAAGPLWVAARRQTEGRGRRGRTWTSPEGNLAASLYWPVPPGLAPEEVATLAFVAGLSLEGALVLAGGPAREGSPPLRLKWPNDVLAGSAKLAGILLEMESLPRGAALVVGFGVNVAAAPEGLPYLATSLAAIGRPAEAEGLLRQLTGTWLRWLRIWDEGRGFPAIREAWLARAAGLEGPALVRAGSERLSGTFETIDSRGRLVLRLPDGARRTVTAGEVHFGSAATAA